MKRNDFIKKSLLSLLPFSAMRPLLASDTSVSGKNSDLNVGFNHLPLNTTTIMKNAILHKADSRGVANHGWLKSFHTFSFANYYNPDRMQFGALRVLNDDYVEAGMGFGTHPHNNMEIISIPLSGDLEHRDSMGNTAVIKSGDIQVMSAGTGITHSEYNKNTDKAVKFLQIWVMPNKQNVQPRYDQITLDPKDRHNKLQQIVSPNANDDGVWINQEAWFHLGDLDAGSTINYTLKKNGNGLYAFVLNGNLTINELELSTRDGAGFWDTNTFTLSTKQKTELLLMEVPMK